MRLQEIISVLNPEKIIYSAGENVEVKEPVPFSIDNSRSDVIFWCNDSLIPEIKGLMAGTLICSNTALQADINKKINYLVVSKPRLAFLKVLELFAKANAVEKGISSTAVIHPSVKFSKEFYVGEHVVIEKNCT